MCILHFFLPITELLTYLYNSSFLGKHYCTLKAVLPHARTVTTGCVQADGPGHGTAGGGPGAQQPGRGQPRHHRPRGQHDPGQ